jgi:ribose/xylose/arabinose/galactoside ABC-type transport system permease subunit
VFAAGGNKEIARALGVRVDRVKLACFMITSTLAAFAGVAYIGRSNYLDPIVATGVELEAIASVVMGGILFSGGAGNLTNAIICAFLLKEVQAGMGVYGIPVVYYKVAIGALLILTVIANRQIIRRITKAQL